MSKRRSKQNTRQQKAKRTTQPIAKHIATSNLCNADVTSPVSLDASKTSVKLADQDTKRLKVKNWMVLVPVIGTIIAGLALLVSFHQGKFGQEANDRAAGRLEASAKILDVIPSLENMKHLFAPIEPPPLNLLTGKPTGIPLFKHLHNLCQTNPRLHVKNTGNQIIGAVRIEVEEKSVMPVGKDALFVPDPSNPKVPRLAQYKPLLDPTLSDNCDLHEKLKPGDEAIIPVWRPLIRAMLKAQKVKSPRSTYMATFDVRCYVQSVGTSAFDRAEGPTSLGFMWSAEGFTEESFKRIQDMPIVAKVVGKNQDPAKVLALDIPIASPEASTLRTRGLSPAASFRNPAQPAGPRLLVDQRTRFLCPPSHSR